MGEFKVGAGFGAQIGSSRFLGPGNRGWFEGEAMKQSRGATDQQRLAIHEQMLRIEEWKSTRPTRLVQNKLLQSQAEQTIKYIEDVEQITPDKYKTYDAYLEDLTATMTKYGRAKEASEIKKATSYNLANMSAAQLSQMRTQNERQKFAGNAAVGILQAAKEKDPEKIKNAYALASQQAAQAGMPDAFPPVEDPKLMLDVAQQRMSAGATASVMAKYLDEKSNRLSSDQVYASVLQKLVEGKELSRGDIEVKQSVEFRDFFDRMMAGSLGGMPNVGPSGMPGDTANAGAQEPPSKDETVRKVVDDPRIQKLQQGKDITITNDNLGAVYDLFKQEYGRVPSVEELIELLENEFK